jgi:hypothetical protein
MASPEKQIIEGLSPVSVWEEFLDMSHLQEEREKLFPSRLEIGARKDVLVKTFLS